MVFRINNVSERDMDLLFLEEIAINRDFLNLFIHKIIDRDLSDYEIVSGEVSSMDPVLGESDLTVILEQNGYKVGLLIEDKISAVAQPRQYERYVERGNKSVKEKLFDAFYVFLIAPIEYCKSNDSASKYPLKVYYEECCDLLKMHTDIRSKLKYQQIITAIESGHKPYIKVVDTTSTSFWNAYVNYMHIHFPDIELKSKVKDKSKNGDWPTYKTSLDMKSVYIHHKMKMKDVEYSYIDLTFNGLAEHRIRLKELLKEMLGDQYDPRFGIHKAGKSAVLRLVAPRCLDWQMPFKNQINIVAEHLSLVAKLCKVADLIDKKQLLAFYAEVAAQKTK